MSPQGIRHFNNRADVVQAGVAAVCRSARTRWSILERTGAGKASVCRVTRNRFALEQAVRRRGQRHSDRRSQGPFGERPTSQERRRNRPTSDGRTQRDVSIQGGTWREGLSKRMQGKMIVRRRLWRWLSAGHVVADGTVRRRNRRHVAQ